MTMRRRRNRYEKRFRGAVFVAEFLRVLGIVDLILTPVGCLAILYSRTNAGAATEHRWSKPKKIRIRVGIVKANWRWATRKS